MSTENGYANCSSSDRTPDDVDFSDGMLPKLKASSMPDVPLKIGKSTVKEAIGQTTPVLPIS